MADVAYRPRGERPPEEIRTEVSRLLEAHGPRELSKRLGMSRDAVLGVAAGTHVLPGTLALLRERLRSLPVEEPKG
jgi:hypothetical protein